MRLADRFRRLDDRVLGPPPAGRRRDPFSPAALAWAAVGLLGSLLTGTTWGLLVFITVGVVGMFAAGLVKSRRTLSRSVAASEAQFTADRGDPVREWLAQRNKRVRSLLILAARFPFIAAPALGAAVGFGISNERGCVTWRGSEKCSFYVPGHHTVAGGAAWGFLVGLLVYAGALLIRHALIRASEAQRAAAVSAAGATSVACAGRQPDATPGQVDPEFVLVPRGQPSRAKK